LKITFFGLTISSSWGNGHATPYRAILKALHRRGHELTFFEKDVEYYAYRRDFTACDYCDLRLYEDWETVRSAALASAAESDVVIVGSYCPEGARIADEVLELQRPLRVYYDLDTPVTLSKLEREEFDHLRSDQIPCFDLYLSFTGGRTLTILEQQWGARLARPLYGCVDPDICVPAPTREDFRCRLSYMGTYSPDRQHKLDDLFLAPARALPQEKFILAGSLYPWHWQWPANVQRHDHVAPGDHAAFYSSSRLTLNITRTEMALYGYCPSGRFFEAAACGTPIVTDWWEGLETFFQDGEEIFVCRSTEQVLEALASADGELAEVASRARRRTLDEHTGEHRAAELLAYCEEARQAQRIPAAARPAFVPEELAP
jgi:spore maturation protein CgeB